MTASNGNPVALASFGKFTHYHREQPRLDN